MLSLLGKQWQQRKENIPDASLSENFLHVRELSLSDFPEVHFSDLADPFLFRDMQKTMDRILQAIEKKEKILIFGDYDADGMTGTAQLYLTLKHLGAEVMYKLPTRAEGYGLSLETVEKAVKKGVQLIITTDCGISNATCVDEARRQKIDVILTDHHSIPEKIPNAFSILHPLLPEETFPDKDLTGSGVAFFLCFALLQEKYEPAHVETFATQLLEFAVLGTIADCGSLFGQNRVVAVLGLQALARTKNPGLRKLLEMSKSDGIQITSDTVGFLLAPRLNAAGRLANPLVSLHLLLGDKEKAHELEVLNAQRKKMVEEFVAEAETMFESDTKIPPCIIVANDAWPSGTLGLIAGKIAEKYGVPALVFTTVQEKMTASCRGPEGFHITAALRKIATEHPEMFLGFGGHECAAGLSLLPEKFEMFANCFREKVIEVRGEIPPPPVLIYDFEISQFINSTEVLSLDQFAPFGVGNPEPLFFFPSMKVLSSRCVGKEGNHLSLFLESMSGQKFSSIFFSQGSCSEDIALGNKVDVISTLEVREWQGEEQLQLKVVDVLKR